MVRRVDKKEDANLPTSARPDPRSSYVRLSRVSDWSIQICRWKIRIFDRFLGRISCVLVNWSLVCGRFDWCDVARGCLTPRRWWRISVTHGIRIGETDRQRRKEWWMMGFVMSLVQSSVSLECDWAFGNVWCLLLSMPETTFEGGYWEVERIPVAKTNRTMHLTPR